MNNDHGTGSQRRASISQWLFGSSALQNDLKGCGNSNISNEPAIDDTSDIKAEENKRTRSGSMTERLGLHKVPTHDHEAIIRGDFQH